MDAVKSANLGERASKLKSCPRRGGPRAVLTWWGRPAAGGPAKCRGARLDRLERLVAMHEKGILSDEELAAEKARLLNADD